ncbi:amino acid adenylation domain-containing protein [Winogradskyella sp.]|uniref:amino acid adenylation domain-containing protein n=1 Tax=Winogradskyella sp. TaxID=1883156 RepID=UPI003BA9F826
MSDNSKKVSLLDKWKNKSKANYKAPSIKKAPLGIDIPLSPAQKRLWFLQKLYPQNPFYNLSQLYEFKGHLDIDVLKKSLNSIFNEHSILKSYVTVKNGIPILKVGNDSMPDLNVLDYSDYDEEHLKAMTKTVLDEQAKTDFDLSEAPLFKSLLIKKSNDRYTLLLTLHHIITDQWSMDIIEEELATIYNKSSTNISVNFDNNSIDYIDYAYEQNKPRDYSESITFWKAYLADVKPLHLPFDFKRPQLQSFKGQRLTQNYSDELSSDILTLSRELGVTPFVFFLSAFYILLYNYAKSEDITIGIPISNRNNKQLEKSIGLFLETLPLRISISGLTTVKDFILKVQNTYLNTLSYKDLPFNEIVKALKLERSLSINPLFQAMMVYSKKDKPPRFSERLELTSRRDYDIGVSKFDLTLFVTEQNGTLSSTFEFATDLFNESTIIRFQEYFKSQLEYIVEDPSQSIASIPMLTKQEKELFFTDKASSLGDFASYEAIHNSIEDVAYSNPNKTAVSFKDVSITYSELNTKANAVAQMILNGAPKHNSVIGLSVDRSVDMIIGILGILKAGCCYLPLDPEYPKERTDYIIKDSNTKLILTQSSYTEFFDAFEDCSYLIIEDRLDAPQPNTELPKNKKDDLAYIIYTSGSTGQPKGVPISHGNIINSTAGRLDFYDENPKVFLLMSSIAFDSSKAGIFWTLCTGGHLVIAEKRIEQDIDKISALIKAREVSHTLMLPSLYNLVLEYSNEANLISLTDVIVAGEACSVSMCQSHFNVLPSVNLYNEYGPTEGTVWCIAHKLTVDDLALTTIPIGKAVANAKVYILDKNFNHVPIGVPGTLYISGPGLSKGYINQPEKTNDVFIVNPNDKNEIIYKTGDLAKYDNDGNIIFLGRTDEQIKIRGFRVELSEIENTINQLNEVKEAVVLFINDGGNSKLMAYVKPINTIDIELVKTKLKAKLPAYMIPNNFIALQEWPLLPNGKIDKKKLEALKPITKNTTSGEPKSDVEKLLVQLWQEVIEIPNIGVNDNFFEIGGDSILSIQITAKARKHGIAIGSNQIFEHQTIAELAMFVYLDNEEKASTHDLFGEVPLMPIQKWFFDTHKNAPQYWNQVFISNKLPESANAEKVRQITTDIIENHPALRSTFVYEHATWKAFIEKEENIDAFHKVDLTKEDSPNYPLLIESHLDKIQTSMALHQGGLFKCVYFDTGHTATNVLALLAHHLVIDFVSWQIIFDHLEEALFNKRGQFFQTASIKEWGTHLLELNNSKSLKHQIDYWKDQIPNNIQLPLDFSCELPILEKDVDTVVLEVDKNTSLSLITEAHNAYSTKTDELLLVALTLTISNWTQNDEVAFALERHGRETTGTNLDVSNTVGWLTAFFPKKLNVVSNDDLGDNIIAIKEALRHVEMGGLGYGVLRYLSEELGNIAYPKIVFNYLGKQSSSKLDFQFWDKTTRDPNSERDYYLEINALYKNNKLVFNWSYASKAIKKETIEQLINEYHTHLKDIVDHCLTRNDVKHTPSDFEDIDLDQDDLDTLFDALDL